MSEVVLSDWVQ